MLTAIYHGNFRHVKYDFKAGHADGDTIEVHCLSERGDLSLYLSKENAARLSFVIDAALTDAGACQQESEEENGRPTSSIQ